MFEGWAASPPFLLRKDRGIILHLVHLIKQTYIMPLVV